MSKRKMTNHDLQKTENQRWCNANLTKRGVDSGALEG